MFSDNQLVQTGKYHRSEKVKIVSQSRPATKLKTHKKKTYAAMMNGYWSVHASPHPLR